MPGLALKTERLIGLQADPANRLRFDIDQLPYDARFHLDIEKTTPPTAIAPKVSATPQAVDMAIAEPPDPKLANVQQPAPAEKSNGIDHSTRSSAASQRRQSAEFALLGVILLLLVTYVPKAWTVFSTLAPEILLILLATSIAIYGPSPIVIAATSILSLARLFFWGGRARQWFFALPTSAASTIHPPAGSSL
jgi:hypothetical protein